MEFSQVPELIQRGENVYPLARVYGSRPPKRLALPKLAAISLQGELGAYMKEIVGRASPTGSVRRSRKLGITSIPSPRAYIEGEPGIFSSPRAYI